ncbi:alpha/beta hydrolase [Nocardia sp. NPDC004068]|uniref:alpha/beta hydrolase n=1 Tax=Nocardia sp. NPDC004068 TaxID=3364303 RepID=UPI0036835790
MSRSETGEFEGRGGRIFWQSWVPEGDVKGVIALVHGVAEHSGRYVHVGERLADAGYAVYALDHVGHGRSVGDKANIDSIDGAADNVTALLDLAAGKHPGVPRFVVAHSMGSLVTLHLATRAPLDVAGIALSAPPLVVDSNPVQRVVAPLVSRIAPNLGAVRVDSTWISRDPEVVRAYDEDPLVYRGRLPARTAAEILETGDAVGKRLDRLTVPTLAMHGTADRIANPVSTDLIERNAAASDLTVRRYPGLYHELFNEPERGTVLDDLVAWLDEHCLATPRSFN